MLSNPGRLSERVIAILETGEDDIFLSPVSGWEISIKYAIEKLNLPDSPDLYIPKQIKKNRIEILPVTMTHTLNTCRLPDIHKDPFDRLLVSQSQCENIPLITNDSKIKQYPVETIWE